MNSILRMLIVIFIPLVAQGQTNKKWPVLKKYDQDHLYRIAMPIGGIGTGTVSLGGRGELRDWEIMNRPAKGFRTTKSRMNAPFFSIYVDAAGKKNTKMLMGPLYDWEYQHMEGRSTEHHGLPRFEKANFETAYPFGIVNLTDDALPVEVSIKAFNPLIPGDADASGIPIAVLRYEVKNTTNKPITVAISGTMRNFIGQDGSKMKKDWKGEFYTFGAKYNKNEFRNAGGLSGIFMHSDSVSNSDPAWGTITLSTTDTENISYRTSSVPNYWSNAILDFWDDFSEDGILTEKKNPLDHEPMASLANKKEIGPLETKTFTFYITWHFPNRTSWYRPDIVGNYYTEQYDDAWDVIGKVLPELPELERKTVKFVDAFISANLPEVVKEAALFNVSTLRSQTVFRTKDGHMFGWEGSFDNVGSCHGSCTHVWNYEQATAFLFGDLARSMRDIEFAYATHENGLMSFRVSLPLERAKRSALAAADGQMGTIMKFYRDWQLSGDNEFLQKHWKNVKGALAFAWIDGGWDGDVDGVMEGCQHNTMDVEYFGPNPQMQIWYLGALKAGKEMAEAMNDIQFATICDKLFNKGSKWTDENLFNGEYYEQIIMATEKENIASGLTAGMGGSNMVDPEFQLAKGCLVDQLVGQYMAHICGLGYLIKPNNVKTTLNSIMKYNYKESLSNHFNNMRSYAMGKESALLMASWPKGRPKVPFPYFSEVMTGFEYTAAIGMLYEGQEESGLKCIKSIRDRYNGSKRNPFDEAECGHHYARAMASWASVLALTGFHYSAVDGTLSFADLEGTYFWSNGHAYGTVSLTNEKRQKKIELKVLGGKLSYKKIIIKGVGETIFNSTRVIKEGNKDNHHVSKNNVKAGLPSYNVTKGDNFSLLKPPVIKDNKGKKIKTTSFFDDIEIIMDSKSGDNILYTLEGTEPTLASNKYQSPLKISESSTIMAKTEKNGVTSYLSSTAKVFKTTKFEELQLLSKPSKKYEGKGKFSLLDGVRGTEDFRDGNWLGFEGEDMVLSINLGEKMKINEIKIGCLINEGAWIFPPKSIVYFVSKNGKEFSEYTALNEDEINSQEKNNINGYSKHFVDLKVQYLKIKVNNMGTCPPGSPGAGNKAWLFVDEIIIY